MFDALHNWDIYLFYKINTVWTNDFLDHVFPWWRDATTWYPVYLFLLVFILINFGWKAWTWILFLVLNVIITDQLCSTVIKHIVLRLRPCNDPFMHGMVRMLINHCGLGSSFPSAHATNHFGAACFLYLTLKPYLKKWCYLFFIWASTVSYGQVYVGLHYPTDILSGAIIGSIIGCVMASVYNKKVKLPALQTTAV
jgi:membrane-associated phospholipid phosphatase